MPEQRFRSSSSSDAYDFRAALRSGGGVGALVRLLRPDCEAAVQAGAAGALSLLAARDVVVQDSVRYLVSGWRLAVGGWRGGCWGGCRLRLLVTQAAGWAAAGRVALEPGSAGQGGAFKV